MKAFLALALALALVSAHAQEKKAEAKKSGKNAAQKAEASVTKWARDNKIWYSSKKGADRDAKK
jgi:hypothetical protein